MSVFTGPLCRFLLVEEESQAIRNVENDAIGADNIVGVNYPGDCWGELYDVDYDAQNSLMFYSGTGCGVQVDWSTPSNQASVSLFEIAVSVAASPDKQVVYFSVTLTSQIQRHPYGLVAGDEDIFVDLAGQTAHGLTVDVNNELVLLKTCYNLHE